MNTILIILIGVTLAALGQVSWKSGMNELGEISSYNLVTLLDIISNPYIFFGLVMYGLGTVFWLVALSKKDLSFVYPFVSLTYILVLVMSSLVLKENIGTNKIVGTLAITIGLIIIART